MSRCQCKNTINVSLIGSMSMGVQKSMAVTIRNAFVRKIIGVCPNGNKAHNVLICNPWGHLPVHIEAASHLQETLPRHCQTHLVWTYHCHPLGIKKKIVLLHCIWNRQKLWCHVMTNQMTTLFNSQHSKAPIHKIYNTVQPHWSAF